MANDKKFVVKNGLTTQNISFVENTQAAGNTITATMLSSDVLSFSGNSGQLFSISDGMSGTIFAVNDISGVPSVEIKDDGTIILAETFGNVGVGTTAPTTKLEVAGRIKSSGLTVTGSGWNDVLRIEGVDPSIYFSQTGGPSAFIGLNANTFYILSDSNNDGAFEMPFPLALDFTSGYTTILGDEILTAGKNQTIGGTKTFQSSAEYPIKIRSTVDNSNVGIEFSTHSSGAYAQKGFIKFNHGDDTFDGVLTGTQFFFTHTETSNVAVVTTGEFFAQGDQRVFHSNYHPNADRLTTTQTLWGQSFNGSAPVSGNLTGVGNIFGNNTGTSYQLIGTNSNTLDSAAYIALGRNTDPSNAGKIIVAGSVIDLRFNNTDATYGTSGLYIDIVGNIGMGTLEPRSHMHIYGAGQTTANLTDAGARGDVLRVSGSGAVVGTGGVVAFSSQQGDIAGSLGFAAIKGLLVNGIANTTGDLAFSTRNATTDPNLTERMRIASTGNIGIWTTSPKAPLHVSGPGQTTANLTDAGVRGGILKVSGSDLVAGAGGAVVFSSQHADSVDSLGFAAIKGLLANGTANTIGDLAFSTRNAVTDPNLSERMRITYDGRIGIGTTTPSVKLHVKDFINSTGYREIANYAITNNADGSAFSSIVLGQTATNVLFIEARDASNVKGSILLQPYGGSVRTGGNAGIGILPSDTVPNFSRFLAIGDADTGIGQISDGVLALATNNSERMRVLNNGYVGIGTVAPSTLLHVNGEITAVDYNTTSDINVKKNVCIIEDALSKVLQLNGVTFSFIDDPDEQRHAGVIAQDVEKVLPEAVKELGSGVKHVAYGNLIGLLVEAIKDQQKQIDELKALINK